jgi:hypothetical protein
LASDEIAKLHYKKGDVVLIRNGEERSMIKGEKIYEGDILETGSKSMSLVGRGSILIAKEKFLSRESCRGPRN